MRTLWLRFGSMRVAVPLLLALALAVLTERAWPEAGRMLSTTFGMLVAASLAVALATQRKARSGALGVFHGALLAVVLLAAFGYLMRYEARVEVTTGTSFEQASLVETRVGPWHRLALRDGDFIQQGFEVDYGPGDRRGATRSVVRSADGVQRTVGDGTPLLVRGYRFYTTHNKGYAPVLAWRDRDGAVVHGVVHMPSYPLNDWNQSNTWVAPSGRVLRLWLEVQTGRAADRAWRLEAGECSCRLVVDDGETRQTLLPGEWLRFADGSSLQFAAMRGWMGYRVFRDPTLPWLLAIALLGGVALCFHAWRRGEARTPEGGTVPVPSVTAGLAAVAGRLP